MLIPLSFSSSPDYALLLLHKRHVYASGILKGWTKRDSSRTLQLHKLALTATRPQATSIHLRIRSQAFPTPKYKHARGLLTLHRWNFC